MFDVAINSDVKSNSLFRRNALKNTGVNPFTGKSIKFSAKPARTSVKIHPLKGLKDMAY